MTKSISTLALLIMALALPVKAANIAANPGFEDAGVGGAADADKWGEFGSQPSTRDLTNPRTGDAAQLLSVNGGGNSVVLQNTIADGGMPSLLENTVVTASFWHDSAYGIGGVGNAALRILNGNGNIVADTGQIGLPATSGYEFLSLPPLNVPAFGAAPNDTYAAFLEISAAAGESSRIFIDDVVIDGSVVPEPSTVALFGLASLGLAFVARRRRR